ncbi:MAG: hypothetical protein IKL20_03860 [Alistipes sp.]|nr:hypothetical protein [Alistipes sp.]
MRKSCLLLLSLFSLCGCIEGTQQQKRKFTNIQQENFDKILAKNQEKSYRLGNSIIEKEFGDSVRLAMGKYMDSVKLFVNWQAKINNINSYETGSSVALSFEIEYQPEQYRKVAFDVDYVVAKKDLDSDKIYNTVKKMSNYSTVFFDGFIRTKANGEADYSNLSQELIHSYPDFKFFIVDINATSKGDTLSTNLKGAVDLSFEAIEPLKLNFKKQISKKESNRRMDEIMPKFKAAKELLTEEEQAYISRLSTALTCNFLYAD